jgi:[ribosomal protein S5]-alanine N-acetyltransferase
MNLPEKINSTRLSLSKINLGDDAFIQQLVNSPGWLKFIGERNVHSQEAAIAYIEKINGIQNLVYWVVRVNPVSEPVGIISFLKRDYLDHFDIGFAFLPQFCGNGYAYEAAKEVLGIVRQQPEYDIVLATTIPGNVSSIKLLEKLGMYFEKEIHVGEDRLQVYTTGKEGNGA